MLKNKIIISFAIILTLIIAGIAVAKTASNTKNIPNQLSLGNKYLLEGRYKEAILVFNKIISIDPKNIEARIGLSKAYIGIGNIEGAEKILNEAIEIEPNRKELYILLTKVYLQHGKGDEITKLLAKVKNSINDESLIKLLENIKANDSSVSSEGGNGEGHYITSLEYDDNEIGDIEAYYKLTKQLFNDYSRENSDDYLDTLFIDIDHDGKKEIVVFYPNIVDPEAFNVSYDIVIYKYSNGIVKKLFQQEWVLRQNSVSWEEISYLRLDGKDYIYSKDQTVWDNKHYELLYLKGGELIPYKVIKIDPKEQYLFENEDYEVTDKFCDAIVDSKQAPVEKALGLIKKYDNIATELGNDCLGNKWINKSKMDFSIKYSSDIDYARVYYNFLNEIIIPKAGLVSNSDIQNLSNKESGINSVFMKDLNNDNVPELITLISSSGDDLEISKSIVVYTISDGKIIMAGTEFLATSKEKGYFNQYFFLKSTPRGKKLFTAFEDVKAGNGGGLSATVYNFDAKNGFAYENDIYAIYESDGVYSSDNFEEYGLIKRNHINASDKSIVSLYSDIELILSIKEDGYNGKVRILDMTNKGEILRESFK